MAAGHRSNSKGFGDDRYRAIIARLAEARKAQGLSQQQLADLLGRHQQFVSRYEIGERRLDVVEFVDIVRALSLDAHEILASIR